MYIIERMRAGRAPKDAAVDALRKVRAVTTDKRLINSRGTPRFGLTFYILSKSGEVAGVSFYSGGKFVVRDEDGVTTLHGVKTFCSGAGGVQRALVVARDDAGERRLVPCHRDNLPVALTM